MYLASWGTVTVAVKVLLVPGAAGTDLAAPGAAAEALALPPSTLAELEAEAALLASLRCVGGWWEARAGHLGCSCAAVPLLPVAASADCLAWACSAVHCPLLHAASARHPCCVNFFGVTRNPPALVTEYCGRGSVAELLDRARASPAVAAELTWRRRLLIALGAADGMAYLHGHKPAPIIHRDLKSPNLLVTDAWQTKASEGEGMRPCMRSQLIDWQPLPDWQIGLALNLGLPGCSQVADFGLSRVLEDSEMASSVAVTNPRWVPLSTRAGREPF